MLRADAGDTADTMAAKDTGSLPDAQTPIDAGCVRPGRSGDSRWLVLTENGPDDQMAVAYRVSASGIIGRWPLGRHQSGRGECFSPDGRLFLLEMPGAPAYVADMSGPELGERKLVREVGYEMVWSPKIPVLLMQDEYPEPSLTVMDARCGGAEVHKVKFASDPMMVNPSPMWAPDGERVAIATSMGTTDLIDFSSGPPTVASIRTRSSGLSCWGCVWSPDGRWLVGVSWPKNGTYQLAGIDTARNDGAVLPLTEIQSLGLSFVGWASPVWFLTSTRNDPMASTIHMGRTDGVPVPSNIEFPSTARLSPAGGWLAYLGDCGVPGSAGICLVELKPDGPGAPIQVATGTPVAIYWTADGKHLVFTVTVGPLGRQEAWLIPHVTSGGRPVRFAPADALEANCSPDSDWCLWRNYENGEMKLYAYNVASASTQLLVNGTTMYRSWSNDGDFLSVFTENGAEIIVFHEQGNMLRQVARFAPSTGEFDAFVYWQP